jgi:sugar transferase (PEP-CTERM system associated)
MIRLFRVLVPVGALTLLLSEIFLISAAFVVAAYFFSPQDPGYYLFYDHGISNIAFILCAMLAALYAQDLYTDIFVQSGAVLLLQLCVTVGVAMLTQALISYVNSGLRMPLHVMVPGVVLAASAIFCWRLLFSRYAHDVVGRDSLLLVGGSDMLTDIASYIVGHPELGLQVAGYVDDSHEFGAHLPGGKVVGRIADLRDVVTATNPARIVVGMPERRSRVPVADLLELRFAGRIIEEAPAAYERVCGRVAVKELRPSQLIYSGELGPRRQTLTHQRVSNFLAALVAAILASPLIILTWLAVRLSSKGPALYRQVRVGMDGAPFTAFKFRSMRVDAEAGTGAVWASKDDPRVTPVGGIIRKIRFDELPQLFNVMRGEMSIVGPRPERPEFVRTLSEQIPYYRQRHCVRPGITGWAQINYKYGDTLEDVVTKLEYDLYYIKNMSLSLDAYIIFHTVKAMLLSRGAQ